MSDCPIQVNPINTPTFQVVVGAQQGPAGPPGDAGQREVLPVTVNQTVFLLAAVPFRQHLTGVFLNGSRAVYGTDYSLNGAVLTWLSAVPLDPLDQLEVTYYAAT